MLIGASAVPLVKPLYERYRVGHGHHHTSGMVLLRVKEVRLPRAVLIKHHDLSGGISLGEKSVGQ